MPIPDFRGDGYLPNGIHECTLIEIEERFVLAFGGKARERRRMIFRELRAHLAADLLLELADHAMVDGSFVSDKPEPADVDIVVGLTQGGLRRLLFGDLAGKADIILQKLEGKISERIAGQQRSINGYAAMAGDHKYLTQVNLFQGDTRLDAPLAKGILRVRLQ